MPTVAAVLFKKGFEAQFMAGLRPVSGRGFAGPAYTVRAIPTRRDLREGLASGAIENLHRKALREIPAGAVFVADTGRQTGCSILGDIFGESLARKGVAGVVLDGGVADIVRFAELDLPLICASSAPVPWIGSLFIAELQGAIGCCGVAVFPGDIIVGDGNGAVCVPASLAADVAREAAQKEELETFLVERVRAGAPVDGTYPPNAETLAAYDRWRAGKTTEGQSS